MLIIRRSNFIIQHLVSSHSVVGRPDGQLKPYHTSHYIAYSVRFILVLSSHVFLAFLKVFYLLSYRLKCTTHPLRYPVRIISYTLFHLITLLIFCEDYAKICEDPHYGVFRIPQLLLSLKFYFSP